MSAQQCRTADWYGLGYRDGDSYGLRSQIDQYTEQCRTAGVDVRETAYLAGWTDGYAEFAARMSKFDSP